MSKYSSIWRQLKTQGHCTLAVPVPLHPRIIKAVTTAKYKDVGYRLQAIDTKKRPILSHRSEQARLRFWLKEYDMFECLEEIDL